MGDDEQSSTGGKEERKKAKKKRLKGNNFKIYGREERVRGGVI